MKSVMVHQFSQVPRAEIQRSSFDRSHGYKTTFDAGYLIPVYCDWVYPGDSFNLSMTLFGRLATPIFPFMDNMFIDAFFFFVPYRLVWDNFQRFMGEQDNPDDSTDFLIPSMTSTAVTGYTAGSIFDYFGLPTEVPGLKHMSLPLRGYNLIYNEWFRDQNLQDSVEFTKDDGPDSPADFTLLRRGKRHDYFTSSLPWPQKGPAVELPIGASAPVVGIGVTDAFNFNVGTSSAVIRETGKVSPVSYGPSYGASSGNVIIKGQTAAVGSYPAIYADLSAATAATINQLRQAFQIQRIYERDARGGTRYTELIQAHFGVTSPDARLQRTEYLGGGTVPLNVNPIAQTGGTSADVETPQGNLAAMATLSMRHVGFTKSFTEHGFVIGLISARADLNYQQGLNRLWSQETRFDLYWPALAHIGEQAVLNKEIYAQGTGNPTADAGVWGYQERYAELRYKPSIITGEFRSNFAQSLDTWHLAQDFASLPVLGSTFIQENPPVDRVIAVETEPQFLLDAYFKLRCARPMPLYSVPGLIDHF